MSTRELVPVQCAECGRTFRVSPNASPECPRCGSTDIEVREEWRPSAEGETLLNLGTELSRAAVSDRWQFCRVCGTAVPKGQLVNGACDQHQDEPSYTKACPECGGVGRCHRDCPRAA